MLRSLWRSNRYAGRPGPVISLRRPSPAGMVWQPGSSRYHFTSDGAVPGCGAAVRWTESAWYPGWRHESRRYLFSSCSHFPGRARRLNPLPCSGKPAWRKSWSRPRNRCGSPATGSKRAPDGKLHDLWMKALALEDASGHRAVLITSDFQGVPKSMSDRVFDRLRAKYGLERHQVMFTFSHNHCGPRLGDDLVDYYPVEAEQVKLVDEYTDLMVERLVSLVGEALAKLAPANLRMGQGTATFAVNRRNNREADVPELLAKGKPLVGPVDHSVPVMTVTARTEASRRSSSVTPATRRRSISRPGAATTPASPSSSSSRTTRARWPCSSTPAAAIRTRCRAAPSSSAASTGTCWPTASRAH